ncbi:hypothetical protein ABPG75_003408 [Micractinium tetrahymenae]
MAGPDGSKIMDGMAEVMDLDYPLDDADWEMMVAGPADDQYNDLLSKEVLQQLGLFGTPADSAEGGGAALKDVPLLLQQPGGGLSGLGSAAKQVAELLAGTHPSMRGTSLVDWLAADGPIVAITATGLPTAAGGGGQGGGGGAAGAAGLSAAALVGSPLTSASATPTPLASSTSSAAPAPTAVASSAPLSPSVAPPAVLADTASLPAAPRAGGPMALQHQLQLMHAALSQPQPMQAVSQPQQQPVHAQLSSGGYANVVAAPGPVFQPMGQPAQPVPAAPAGWQQAPMPAAASPPGFFLPQQEVAPGPPADLLALLSGISGAAPASGSHPPTPSGSTAAAEAATVATVAPEHTGAGPNPLLAQLLSELSGLQGLELPPAAPAAALPAAPALASAPEVSVAAAPAPSAAPSITLGGPRGMEEDEEDGPSSGLFTAGADSKPTTLKRFSDRQKARISKIESELAKLQRDMHKISSRTRGSRASWLPAASMFCPLLQNIAVEQQLRTQQPLQQLAAAATSATAAAAAAAEQQQQLLGCGAAPAGQPGQSHACPPLALASGLSPPNSQKKLLLQLSDGMRPQDREMMAVAALTWPKLQDWYCKQVAGFKDALQKAPSLGAEEAERACKEALRAGRYWDLLVLISRPDLSARLLQENMLGSNGANPSLAAAASWAPAAVEAMQLSPEQRSALAAAWQRHREAAEQRAAKRQELLLAIRNGFLVHLQKASPEDIELGKPLARQGLGAMEALRLVVRQEHVSAVQIACGLRKVLTSLQQARLAAAAWPWYPDPAKWAPLLLEAAAPA